MRIDQIAAGLITIVLVAGVARNAGARTPEQVAQDLHDAEAAAKRHSAELTKIQHVRAVTVQIDPRGDAVILVWVDQPKNADAVRRQLPSQIEGFPVGVDPASEVLQGDVEPIRTPPTIDKTAIYNNTWAMRTEPATNPDAAR